jgi:transcriptional regulator with XRE-family HTH domain
MLTARPVPTLYTLRLRAGFRTQRALAAHLRVHTETYGLWERGQHNPSPARFVRLAKALGVSQAVLWEVLRGAVDEVPAQHIG